MSRLFPVVAALALLTGCLSSAPDAPTYWTIASSHSVWPSENISKVSDDVRIARIDVYAPYNGNRIAVLRPDGSLAFDAFNAFAVAPSSLLKGAAQDAVGRYGYFRHVFASASSAKTRYALEFDVTMLALDCRVAGKYAARVEVTAILLDGREVVGVSTGEATGRGVTASDSDGTADGDYSEAFSSAFFHAVEDALGKLLGK